MASEFFFFFFNDTATTEIYTLSLHDALPICRWSFLGFKPRSILRWGGGRLTERSRDGEETVADAPDPYAARSEEHTSELQSRQYLVCRLLLEKKKNP